MRPTIPAERSFIGEPVDGPAQPGANGKGEVLARLLAHAAVHMSDRSVRDDWDTVLSLAQSETDAKALRRYRTVRMAARNFEGGSWTANNHNLIPLNQLERVAPTTGVERTCSGCGETFAAKRKDARSCSARCRKRTERDVTDKRP